MPHRHVHGQPVLRAVQSVGYLRVPPLAADAWHQGSVGLDAPQAPYLVVGGLAQQHDAAQRMAHVAVAGCLPAPRRAVHDGTAVVNDPYHGIVIVHQFRAFDMAEPQPGVRALARAARTEEHIGTACVAHHRGMEQCRTLVGCRQGEEHHQCIVDGHLAVMTRRDEAAVAIAVCADQPSCRRAVPAEFEDRPSVGRMSADDLLSHSRAVLAYP